MFRHVLIALLFPSLLSAQGIDEAARARAAVNRGEILRLSKVMPAVQDKFGGRVLDTSLIRRGSSYTYEFSILTSDSRLIDVAVDAASGKVIGVGSERRAGDGSRAGGGSRPGGGEDRDDDRDDDRDADGPDDDDGDDDDRGDNDKGDDGSGDDDGGDSDEE